MKETNLVLRHNATIVAVNDIEKGIRLWVPFLIDGLGHILVQDDGHPVSEAE